jgi:hydrogenase maturation protease
MNTKSVDAIANAVLYEGYLLYPYRPSSIKNRQRFNFGVLYPKAYSDAQTGSDTWNMQTECLIEGASYSAIELRVRFLKLVARSFRKLQEPALADKFEESLALEPASLLEVDDTTLAPWQEAIECEVAVPPCNLSALTAAPVEWGFAFPAKEESELLRNGNGRLAGKIVRKQESVEGIVEIKAVQLADGLIDGLFKVQVRIKNVTAFQNESCQISRDAALMQSLVSAHVLLGGVDAQFVSLLDPPENLKEFAADCQNLGAWPVLVGADGERDTMLSSPIILYDYPQIAPESPGDLFDGTEIDEILALRILTMTDDEKSEMRNSDERARRMLERTENLPMEHLMKLHGTLRELRSLKEETP